MKSPMSSRYAHPGGLLTWDHGGPYVGPNYKIHLEGEGDVISKTGLFIERPLEPIGFMELVGNQETCRLQTASEPEPHRWHPTLHRVRATSEKRLCLRDTKVDTKRLLRWKKPSSV